jgi:membrane protein implicated in regulation of membrane protease activity
MGRTLPLDIENATVKLLFMQETLEHLSLAWVIFAISLTLGLLILGPKLFKKLLNSQTIPAPGADEMIGKTGKMTEPLWGPGKTARAVVHGKDCAVQSEDILQIGDDVAVVVADSVILKVKKVRK